MRKVYFILVVEFVLHRDFWIYQTTESGNIKMLFMIKKAIHDKILYFYERLMMIYNTFSGLSATAGHIKTKFLTQPGPDKDK